MLSDSEIMIRVQQGELKLFQLLVERYQQRLERYACNRLGDRHLASDAVQEALLAAFQARDSYSPEFAFSTWIWTILRNVSHRMHARQVRHASTGQFAAELAELRTQPPSPGEALLLQERQEQLHLWLSRIPESEAEALRLRFFGELSFEEIARTMDSSISGAKVRVKRGLQRLAELMSAES